MKLKSRPFKVEQRPVGKMQKSHSRDDLLQQALRMKRDSGKPIGGVSPQVGSTSSAIILSPQQFINLRPESELLAPTASAQFKSQQIVNFSTTQGKSTVCGESDVKIHGPDTHFQPLPDPTGDFCCTLCPKKFNRQDLLRKHNKSHVNSVCTLCRQVFNDKHALTKHQIESHTMDRIFQCPQCDKCFKEVRTLRLHLKIHNSEYPEQCAVCQKVFRTKWQLKQHQMDHGGERPYPCPECAFTCKTKQQLNEHRRKHSGEKAYSCTQCGTRFTYRNGLIKHTKLNRCPKRSITIDGETIVKKRSRNLSSKSKTSSGSLSIPAESNGPSGTLQGSSSPVEAVADIRKRVDSHFLIPNVNLNEVSFGLLTEIPQSISNTHATTKIETTHQALVAGVLPDSTVSELSLATGLPESEIRSWAACLPAGSTVKVTHHFDTSILAKAGSVPIKSQMEEPVNSIKTRPLNEIHRFLPALKVRYSSGVGQPLPQPGDIQVPEILMNAAVGITPYQESFAVDPNEILQKDFSKLTHIYHPQLSAPNSESARDLKTTTSFQNLRILAKEERQLSDFDEDEEVMDVKEEMDTKSFVSQNFMTVLRNNSTAKIDNLKFPLSNNPSMIHSANSRLLNCSRLVQKLNFNSPVHSRDRMSSGSPTVRHQSEGDLHFNVKLEPVHSPVEPSSPDSSFSTSFPSCPMNPTSPPSTASAPYTPSSVGSWSSNALLPDFDIDLPDMCDDSDPCGFSINDQDLTSIRAILEQTFKDGRDVLDIISTVY